MELQAHDELNRHGGAGPCWRICWWRIASERSGGARCGRVLRHRLAFDYADDLILGFRHFLGELARLRFRLSHPQDRRDGVELLLCLVGVD